MNKKLEKIYDSIKESGGGQKHLDMIRSEIELTKKIAPPPVGHSQIKESIYDKNDFTMFSGYKPPEFDFQSSLKTLDELMDRDAQRENDGFPRRIRVGKIQNPSPGKKGQVVIVPTTTEPKFYHDDSITEDEESETGGSGDGDDGEVLGEQEAQPQQGEGEGGGPGEGQDADHEIEQQAFDLGRVLTEKFQLPNLKDKGKKRSMTKYKYDLTDRNRGFGQVLDKKETLKKVVETNIQLGRVDPSKNIETENFLISPQDMIYRILSKELDFETQAVVFFIRDYSGSMQGKPTEVVSQQHLFLYSWLMYQYHNNVETRFILHDTEAREVDDFYSYYNSQVAGGTKIAPAFELANRIIEEEALAVDNNIYIFHGTDGDDWDETGKESIPQLKKLLQVANRIGITVAKNSWTTATTTVEKYLEKSNLLKKNSNLIQLDVMKAIDADEKRIIEGIKKLIS